MAITIIQTPLAIQPANNPILFLISSTNTAQANFRFIAEIKNSGGTVLAKLKFPIIPSTIRGWINIQRILESYVTHDFNIDTITGSENSSSWFEYSVSFGEEYGSTPAEYTNLTASGALRIFNASLDQLEEFSAYTTGGYVTATGTSDGRWLSAFGSSKRIGLDQRDFLNYLAINTTGPVSIQVVATLSSGGPTTSRFSPGTLGAGRRSYRIPSGPQNLNLIASLISGTPGAVIPATCTSYTVQLYDGSAYGPVFTYTIQPETSIYQIYDLYFLNRFGGFESFRLSRRSDISRTIERSTYDQPLVRYSDAGASVGFAETGGSRTIYDTKVSKKVRLVSDWLTPEENEAAVDLLTSPLVYAYLSGELREIVVQETAHSSHRRENDKLKSLEINAIFSVTNRRQSR